MEFRALLLLSLSLLLAPLGTAAKKNSSAPPFNPYNPVYTKCPSDLAVRSASSGLSSEEQAWRELRFKNVLGSLGSYLNNANISGFDVSAYLAKIDATNVPVAGLAISGGGSQSGMTGLGLWQAFDDRYEPAVQAGTGGLVQCLSYLSGLSGGGFNMVLPVATNNFSTLADITKNSNLTQNYVTGGATSKKAALAYFTELFTNAVYKEKYMFPVSITDIFGQFFRQYLPASWAYGNVSDIANPDTAFSQGLAPMPIVLFAEVVPGQSPEIKDILYPGATASSTVYEETPFEFGSWIGGRVQAFFSTKFLGTTMNKGKPVSKKACVNGFDKVTFAQGTTGNAFNFYFIDDFAGIPLFYKRDINIPKKWRRNPQVKLVEEVASTFNQTFNASLWATYPNPFTNYNKDMANVEELLLVDGSEVGETIPLRPLIVPERKLDFIIAYDSSGEEPGNNWVNGTTFMQSALHAKQLGIPFPTDIPDSATFVNLGINRYPTFFGCNDSASTPLVLYLPNAPYSAYTNYTFETASFTDNQLELVFENSLNVASWGQGKVSAGQGFPSCIACGMIYKSLGRTGQSIPDACKSCFLKHCYNGTVDNNPLYPSYEPSLLLNPKLSYAKWNATVWNGNGGGKGSGGGKGNGGHGGSGGGHGHDEEPGRVNVTFNGNGTAVESSNW